MTSATDLPDRAAAASFDAVSIFDERESERYALHTRHLNEMMVRVLKTIGYDVGFQRGTGPYLFDRSGVRYLDLLSGWGVFGVGRNHPKLREALSAVLACDLPNLVQMDVARSPGYWLSGCSGTRPFSRRSSSPTPGQRPLKHQ
jgi:ornithine--oxo-acid transaminase